MRPLGASASLLLFVTVHRRENFGVPLQAICLALRDIADRYCGQVPHLDMPSTGVRTSGEWCIGASKNPRALR